MPVATLSGVLSAVAATVGVGIVLLSIVVLSGRWKRERPTTTAHRAQWVGLALFGAGDTLGAIGSDTVGTAVSLLGAVILLAAVARRVHTQPRA